MSNFETDGSDVLVHLSLEWKRKRNKTAAVPAFTRRERLFVPCKKLPFASDKEMTNARYSCKGCTHLFAILPRPRGGRRAAAAAGTPINDVPI